MDFKAVEMFFLYIYIMATLTLNSTNPSNILVTARSDIAASN